MKRARSELFIQYVTINVNQRGRGNENIVGLDDIECL